MKRYISPKLTGRIDIRRPARHVFLPGRSLTGKRRHWPRTNDLVKMSFVEHYGSPIARWLEEWASELRSASAEVVAPDFGADDNMVELSEILKVKGLKIVGVSLVDLPKGLDRTLDAHFTINFTGNFRDNNGEG